MHADQQVKIRTALPSSVRGNWRWSACVGKGRLLRVAARSPTALARPTHTGVLVTIPRKTSSVSEGAMGFQGTVRKQNLVVGVIVCYCWRYRLLSCWPCRISTFAVL